MFYPPTSTSPPKKKLRKRPRMSAYWIQARGWDFATNFGPVGTCGWPSPQRATDSGSPQGQAALMVLMVADQRQKKSLHAVGCKVLGEFWFGKWFSEHAVQASQLMSFDKACWTLDNFVFGQNLALSLAWVQKSVGQVRVLSRHMWVYPFFQTRYLQFHIIKGSQKHTVSVSAKSR